jgi:hypothetical protein
MECCEHAKVFPFFAVVLQVGNVVVIPKRAAVRQALHAANLLTMGVAHQIVVVVSQELESIMTTMEG